jgi:hypothetical protein
MLIIWSYINGWYDFIEKHTVLIKTIWSKIDGHDSKQRQTACIYYNSEFESHLMQSGIDSFHFFPQFFSILTSQFLINFFPFFFKI